MDDVANGLSNAFKGAVSSAKKGFKLTKHAWKTVEKLARVPGASTVMRNADLRRLFQIRYGAEFRNEKGEKVAAAEMSDVESSDDEPLTDAQIHEKVDKKFFDKNYDAMKHEISQMSVLFTEDDVERKKQREETENTILDLRQKCEIVSITLKKRVLMRHQEFVSGVEEIRQINDGLLQISSDCKKGRSTIRKAKGGCADAISILSHHRTKKNLLSTLSVLQAMKKMCFKCYQLNALIESGKLVEASDFLQKEGPIEQEDQLNRIFSIRNTIDEWKKYRDNRGELRKCIELVMQECLITKFIPSKYRNAFESSQVIGDPSETCSLVAQLLWETGVQILTKSFIEVSDVKDETASLVDIVYAIHPDHLMLCFCQVCAKLADFFHLFATILKLHTDESENALAQSTKSLHKDVISEIEAVGKRIARDLVQKITLALEGARFDSVDLDRVLHTFNVVGLLTESCSVLGLDKSEQSIVRTQIKGALLNYIENSFNRPKAHEVLRFMTDELWVVSDLSAHSMNVVLPLEAEAYRQSVKSVKRFLRVSDSADPSTGGSTENPFYSPEFMLVQDKTSSIKTESFSAYWQREGLQGTPPTLLTSSSLAVASTLLEYVARVAIRFPPLAVEILCWMKNIVSLYIYTSADNFVSISKNVPLEKQGELTIRAQAMVTEMRTAAESCVNAANNLYAPLDLQKKASLSDTSVEPSSSSPFPPRVWGKIKNSFANESLQYALSNRVVAGESCFTLACFFEAFIRALKPVVPDTVASSYLQKCEDMKLTAHELLHVGVHRLCQAIFPMENTITEISKMKLNPKEVKQGAYIAQLVEDMVALNKKRQPMPTPLAETLFLRRFIFAVQTTLLREYAKLAKKKFSDILVMQVQVDVQSFQQQVAASFGKDCVVLPLYILSVIKTGFIDSKEQRSAWLKENHKNYYAVDLLNWLSFGDRYLRTSMEDILQKENHHDVVPLMNF